MVFQPFLPAVTVCRFSCSRELKDNNLTAATSSMLGLETGALLNSEEPFERVCEVFKDVQQQMLENGHGYKLSMSLYSITLLDRSMFTLYMSMLVLGFPQNSAFPLFSSDTRLLPSLGFRPL